MASFVSDIFQLTFELQAQSIFNFFKWAFANEPSHKVEIPIQPMLIAAAHCCANQYKLNPQKKLIPQPRLMAWGLGLGAFGDFRIDGSGEHRFPDLSLLDIAKICNATKLSVRFKAAHIATSWLRQVLHTFSHGISSLHSVQSEDPLKSAFASIAACRSRTMSKGFSSLSRLLSNSAL